MAVELVIVAIEAVEAAAMVSIYLSGILVIYSRDRWMDGGLIAKKSKCPDRPGRVRLVSQVDEDEDENEDGDCVDEDMGSGLSDNDESKRDHRNRDVENDTSWEKLYIYQGNHVTTSTS